MLNSLQCVLFGDRGPVFLDWTSLERLQLLNGDIAMLAMIEDAKRAFNGQFVRAV